ncbi:DEAD/DEAH box helicase [Sulfobacillus thermosulfidooxidans]|uniref:DEAD/DEAH box helicase n=1 Tax=Sulfobacillus thermosulfidooxidans TaxID=28034 RepID=UPI0006B67D2B|nr:DEAD/DEAH box helicase [Sulfobacillus thermosulfidooxidans]
MNDEFYLANEWNVVFRHNISSRNAEYTTTDDLALSPVISQYLRENFSQGIYLHQHDAIWAAVIKKQHLCLATGTASGKTLPFMITAMNILSLDPKAKILALYPTKALGYEQEQRWRESLQRSGLPIQVGRIDGDIPSARRLEILVTSHILVATPDVIHTWMLATLDNRKVRNFIHCLKFVIVDEVHSFTGVFGSNSAYLFRRLHHAAHILGSDFQYMAASATIANPEEHLYKLFGVPFEIIDQDFSPKHDVQIEMVIPPNGDFLTQVVSLLSHLTSSRERFIAFVDSRKQTEQIATIMSRMANNNLDNVPYIRRLETLDVLPYRAGYEEYDRTQIQERLTSGNLIGVVSTSALELGLDIPALSTGVLVGVPNSATSFQQRIGRIGRHAPGRVIVIKSGNPLDDVVFRHPKSLFSRPLSEGALYLENRRIQYIHALALARQGGEHDLAIGIREDQEIELESSIDWPQGFSEIVQDERTGTIPVEFQTMKEHGGDRPNLAYALRDVDLQFKVILNNNPHDSLGALSYGQVLREAYPGAVYYYATAPYRVTRVDTVRRLITVRPEKHYTTSPSSLPTQIYPNLTEGNVHQAFLHGDLISIECNLQIHNVVVGFTERRGRAESHHAYPLPLGGSIQFRSPRFYRYYFSSGVIFNHPELRNLDNAKLDSLASLLFEGFLMTIPFERQDIGYGSGRHRREANRIGLNDRFIALFDQTYGSLRLSSRLMDTDVFGKLLENCVAIIETDYDGLYPQDLLGLVDLFYKEFLKPRQKYSPYAQNTLLLDNEPNRIRVIAPGSMGLALGKSNQEVIIQDIFFHPLKKLSYRVDYPNDPPNHLNPPDIIWSFDEVIPIDGISEFVYYDMNTGQVIKI